MNYSSKPVELEIIQERITSQIGRGNFSTLATPVTDTATANRKVRRADSLVLALSPSITDTSAQLSYLSTLTNRQKDTCEAYWYHPDHLGSSSWITYTDGSAVQHLHHLPWGEDFVDQRSTNWNAMYTFSAKEKDAETGYSYFGSRYYSSDLSIWLSVDPMSDKYPSLSPYTYCANNPVKLVDPNGEEINPIYDLNGFFLGTDDKGLQGEEILMKREHFKQNMDHNTAVMIGNIDRSIFNVSFEAKARAALHRLNLPNRPDWDGMITDAEARSWYRNGHGAPLFINMEKLNLTPVTLDHFTKLEGNPYNFFFSMSADKDIKRVYGTLTLNLLNSETGEVQVGNPSNMYIDTYDFNSGGSLKRNIATKVASLIVGEGTPFKIYGWGENPKISVK